MARWRCADWLTVTGAPVVVNTEFNLIVPATDPQKFFRLHKP